MRKVAITEVRAHHVRSIYFDYLRMSKLPRADHYISGNFTAEYQYPIFITDTIDDLCGECRTYPAINFCKGPKTRNKDHNAAEILGIEIGRTYSADGLLRIFQAKAIEQDIDVGQNYDFYYLLEKFYGKDWKNFV